MPQCPMTSEKKQFNPIHNLLMTTGGKSGGIHQRDENFGAVSGAKEAGERGTLNLSQI